LGLSLSYGIKIERAEQVALKLYNKSGGHNKFLESIQVWLDVTAPRYWWQEADTYRVGTSKQSASTMHTLMKRPLTEADFVLDVPDMLLEYLNTLIHDKQFDIVKNLLPEGFLQRRIWNLNYMVIRNIVQQRRSHRLFEWKVFCQSLHQDLKYSKFIGDLYE
jgi:hypothetical protein